MPLSYSLPHNKISEGRESGGTLENCLKLTMSRTDLRTTRRETTQVCIHKHRKNLEKRLCKENTFSSWSWLGLIFFCQAS